MYENILIPVDGSEVSANAAREGLNLAGRLGSSVTFMYVVDVSILTMPDAETAMVNADIIRESIVKQGNEVVDALMAEAGGVKTGKLIVEGDVHEEIVRVSGERKADLIVMGTHGRRGINRLLLGSVAESVARRAHCAVLLVRPR
ncbi:MAG TPA: universal stress protein [Nitrospirota bacterium]